jgi:1A family penicillin-binding protein
MARVGFFQKTIIKVASWILEVLTWFIRLVAFIGDVTIWVAKQVTKSLFLALKKFNLDLIKTAQVKTARKVLGHPLVKEERSFKVGLIMIFMVIFGAWYTTRDLPSPKQLESRQIPQTTKILDRNGQLLYDIYLDQNRTVVPLSQIPENLKHATIAIEDKDFYKHKGFDVWGIARAFRQTVFAGDIQGGSTITQQLVKSVFLSPERTLTRKAKELYLAFRVEMAYSKDQILEMYLNQVPYGGTAFGVEAASEQYFGKHIQDLDLAESALLAGLPVAPSYYSPYGQNPQRAKDRQLLVLRRMLGEHYITQSQSDEAAKEGLKFIPSATNINAPHFVMFVREYLAQKYGDAVVSKGGLKVTTTLELELQEKAQQIVKDNIDKLGPLRVSNGAALVTKPGTGEILAMVGSKDYFDQSIDGAVNLTTALRQPGSSIKPINYATALEHKLITPATIIMDVPTTFSGGPRPYSPVNYDGKFHGAVTVRNALGNSFNIPAVKVLALNGVNAMISIAQSMGITTFTEPARYGLSLTLGGGEVKMVDMATAFGVFANQGKRIDLTPILKVEDAQGHILEQYNQRSGTQALSPQTAFLMSSILTDNSARLMEFGASSGLVIPGKTVAVKTGTTDDKRDNWTIGYTPSYLVAAWVGNNDNTPMNPYLASGITGAAPIWNQIMTYVLRDKINEAFNVPTGVVGINICGTTGGAKTDSCPNNHFEYFISGTEPKQDTFVKAKAWVDKTTGLVVPAGSPNAEEQEQIIVKDVYQDKSYCVSCPQTQVLPSPSPTPNP